MADASVQKIDRIEITTSDQAETQHNNRLRNQITATGCNRFSLVMPLDGANVQHLPGMGILV